MCWNSGQTGKRRLGLTGGRVRCGGVLPVETGSRSHFGCPATRHAWRARLATRKPRVAAHAVIQRVLWLLIRISGCSSTSVLPMPGRDPDESELRAASVPDQNLSPTDAQNAERLTLERFKRTAFRLNPTLREAVSIIEGEEGKALQAGLSPNTSIGYWTTNVGTPGGPIMMFGYIQQEFVSAGKLPLSRQNFLVRVTAAQLEALMQLYHVANPVKIGYVTTLGQQHRVAIERERLKTAKDVLVTTQELFNLGQANRANLHLAQARLQEQELPLTMAENWRTVYVAIEGLLIVDGLAAPRGLPEPGHITAVPKPR